MIPAITAAIILILLLWHRRKRTDSQAAARIGGKATTAASRRTSLCTHDNRLDRGADWTMNPKRQAREDAPGAVPLALRQGTIGGCGRRRMAGILRRARSGLITRGIAGPRIEADRARGNSTDYRSMRAASGQNCSG
jgi:hypothetical protein